MVNSTPPKRRGSKPGYKRDLELVKKSAMGHRGKKYNFKTPKTAWNKGLTKGVDNRVRKYGLSGSKTITLQGRVAWNKGLTKEVDARVASYGIAQKGKCISDTTKEKISQSMKNWYLKGNKNPNLGKPNRHRKGETSIEKQIRFLLDSMDIPYRQEKYFTDIGTVDFYLPRSKTVIECDGTYWHSFQDVKIRDARRDEQLLSKGYQTLRLPEELIWNSPEKCENLIGRLEYCG